ncbi:MAG TPA: hypothetical protein PK696_06420 [bacterium]|nr:hypothetical protein [Chlamydiota bacterium]HOE27312.1 hypothetical protein [bacterium]HQM53253.1 hypothetical protein [bacterium]
MSADARKPLVAPLVAALSLATFCLAVFEITEHDYWWHLATGNYILEHRLVPRMDVFSYTATLPWVAHYWLSDLLGCALFRIVGTPGLILLNAAAIAVSFRLVYLAAHTAGGGGTVAAAVTLAAVFASRPRFYVRPETFSFVLLALYLYLLSRWKVGRCGNRILLLLPPLQMLWANLYGGGSILGLLLLGCVAAGEALNAVFWRRGARGAVVLAAAALAAFLLSFVNPNTHRVVFYFLMSRDPIFRHIVEWRRFGLTDLLSLHGLFLAAGVLLLARSWRRPDFSDLALFLAFGAISIDAPRSLPFFAMVSVPIVAPHLRLLLSRPLSSGRISGAWRRHGTAAQGLAALAVAGFTVWYLFSDAGRFAQQYPFGLGVNWKLVPKQAVDFVEKNRVEGPIFNSYGIGGYLIWRLHPREKVFVDGRVEMYGTEFLETYMRYWMPEVWDGYVERYGISCAIIDREPDYTTRHLDDSPDWALVFFDDRAMVYLRTVPKNRPLIERHRYRYIRPAEPRFAYLDPLLADPAIASAVTAELRRSLGDERWNLNTRLMLGYCYARLGGGFLPRALEEYRRAAALMPEGRDIRAKIAWIENEMAAAAARRGPAQ